MDFSDFEGGSATVCEKLGSSSFWESGFLGGVLGIPWRYISEIHLNLGIGKRPWAREDFV